MTKEATLDKESYRQILETVAQDQGLQDVKFDISTGSSKGDNYLGSIYRVRVRGTKAGRLIDLHLVLKTATTAIMRETVPTEEAYKRESYVYNTVLRELEKVQEEKGVDPRYKFSFVKCYHASDVFLEEMLVLEDLKVQGFLMFDRFKSADYNHVALVMSALGKLHALSYVLEKTKPKVFNAIASKCTDILCHGPFGKAIESYFEGSGEIFLSVIENTKAKAKVEVFLKDINERMQAATRPSRFAVMGHGDCWVNNMLFKYKNGVPVEIRLLDFQLVRYGSPVLDMLYFIFCCTDRAFRAKNYCAMLDMYHDTLAESLKAHSLDVENIFSKEDFLLEIKRFADFGLGMAILTLRFIASDPDDAPDVEAVMKDKNKITITIPSGEGHARYVERVNGVVEDYIEYGYLQ